MNETYKQEQQAKDSRENYLKRKYEAKVLLARSGLRSIKAFTGLSKKDKIIVKPDDPEYIKYK